MNEKDVKEGKRLGLLLDAPGVLPLGWANVGASLRVVAVDRHTGELIVEVFDGRMNAITVKLQEV